MSESITCPICARTSYNPNDVREGYCGACHGWTSQPCELDPAALGDQETCPICRWPAEKHPHA